MASDKTTKFLSTFIQLETEARHAANIQEFSFAVCNSSKQIIDFHQAIFWYFDIKGSVKIQAISAVAQLNQNAPFMLWLKKVIKEKASGRHQVIENFNKDSISEKLHQDWQEFIPPNALWCPFVSPTNKLMGGLMFNRQNLWYEHEITIAHQLIDAYQHSWFTLQSKPSTRFSNLNKSKVKKLSLGVAIGLTIMMLIPARQSVLAPAEIAAKDPIVVSSPIAGVIEQIEVHPNQEVSKGQSLFNIDPTDFKNRYEVSVNDLISAREKYRKAAQHSFNNPESKGQLATLKTEIQKSEAELKYTKELLNKIHIRSPEKGIVIFSDKNDWLGKPVAIGERVMLIANPQEKEIDISLPIQDAITLKPGSKIKLFLNTNPLHPINATLRYASYSATPQPDGSLVYRLKASFPEDIKTPRIGLTGTAKLYGDHVTVFYYLFWRPISAIRRTLGL